MAVDIRSISRLLLASNRCGSPLVTDSSVMKERLIAALDWIRVANQRAGGQGISKGYDLLRGTWSPAYPETTGYTIPTLLNAARYFGAVEYRLFALELADDLLQVTTPEGGVVHWKSAVESQPIVFDTGQVMFGWLAAYEESGKAVYLDAARRAGDWLVSIQEPEGMWKANQYLGYAKVIDTRVSWALLLLYSHVQNDRYVLAARKNLEWALREQQADGWFNHCAFTATDDPITHTIAYTVEGLFECGLILEADRYIAAARAAAEALAARQRRDGSLAGTFGAGWKQTSRWSCLTGDCQMAILWLRLSERDRNPKVSQAAQKIIDFVLRTQVIDPQNQNLHGGLTGSHPVTGAYERMKLPNWAAKFFADALLSCLQTGTDNPILFRG